MISLVKGLIDSWLRNPSQTNCSNHSVIVLELDNATSHPPSPFKFNSHWLEHLDYLHLMTSSWVPLLVDDAKFMLQLQRNGA
jgi:hypothetical protein